MTLPPFAAPVLQVGPGFGFAFFGAMLIFFVLLFVVFLFVALWVYRDAESRGMSGVLWLILVLVAPIIGLILYLVLREEPTRRRPYAPPPPPETTGLEGRTCPSCRRSVPADARFCPQCGVAL
jgi:heme/copper-type cytochrome/quinol oxidase subunit 2